MEILVHSKQNVAAVDSGGWSVLPGRLECSEILSQQMVSFVHCIIIIIVSVADATLLGAPLFPGKVFDDTWLACCEDLKRAVDRLSLLSAQAALLLLRVSFSAPRV